MSIAYIDENKCVLHTDSEELTNYLLRECSGLPEQMHTLTTPKRGIRIQEFGGLDRTLLFTTLNKFDQLTQDEHHNYMARSGSRDGVIIRLRYREVVLDDRDLIWSLINSSLTKKEE